MSETLDIPVYTRLAVTGDDNETVDNSLYEVTICSKTAINGYELRSLLTVNYGDILGRNPVCRRCIGKNMTDSIAARFLVTMQDSRLDFKRRVETEQVTVLAYERRCCYWNLRCKEYEEKHKPPSSVKQDEHDWPRKTYTMPRMQELSHHVSLHVEDYGFCEYKQRTFFVIPTSPEDEYMYFIVQFEAVMPRLLLLDGLQYPVAFYVIAFEKRIKLNIVELCLPDGQASLSNVIYDEKENEVNKKHSGPSPTIPLRPLPVSMAKHMGLPPMGRGDINWLTHPQPNFIDKRRLGKNIALEVRFGGLKNGIENSEWRLRKVTKPMTVQYLDHPDSATNVSIITRPAVRLSSHNEERNWRPRTKGVKSRFPKLV